MKNNKSAEKIHDIVIIGAGWAGLTAAYQLTKYGYTPLILERAPTAGGRARTIKFNGHLVDNGQHILIGAYKNILNILKEINAPIHEFFLRTNLKYYSISKSKQFKFKLHNFIPHPFNLIFGIISASGINFKEKFLLLKFCYKLKKTNFEIKKDTNLKEFLLKNNQTENIIKYFWEPIAQAALTTPIKKASTKIFLKVIKDTFSPPKSNSHFLFPKKDLSEIFPNPVINAIKDKIELKYSKPAKAIYKNENNFTIITNTEKILTKKIILATPLDVTRKLIENTPELSKLKSNLDNLTYENIITIYFEISENVEFNHISPIHMYGMIDSYSHWVFKRCFANQPNILSIVISSSRLLDKYNKEEFANKIFNELKNTIPNLKNYTSFKIINEKKAAFSAKRNSLQYRPNNATKIEGLYLAGDYINTSYPATLEGAVISGIKVAKYIIFN